MQRSASPITRRSALLALAAAPCLAQASRGTGADEPPPELRAELPRARLLGQSSLRFMGLHVYDIRLWGEGAVDASQPETARLALELQYARTFSGAQLAERSLEEMRALGPVGAQQGARWLQRMRRIFPDVARGDRITGLQLPGEAARFFLNGQLRGELRDAEFTRLFFGIWLSPRSSQPQLREALLGARGDKA